MAKKQNKRKSKKKSNTFTDLMFKIGVFFKQYTEWVDALDDLLKEMLKTEKYKEILKRSYSVNDYQVLLSVFRELDKKREKDFNAKLYNYKQLKIKLQKQQTEVADFAMKDVNQALKQKKKLLHKQYGFFKGNRLYKDIQKHSMSDIENLYEERKAYWEKFKLDDVIESRMLLEKKEMKECLLFYEYAFKKIAKLDTSKQHALFLKQQEEDFHGKAPALIEE